MTVPDPTDRPLLMRAAQDSDRAAYAALLRA
jgi:hypothetical protein